MARRVKRLPARQETWDRSLGREDPLEKEMATHSDTLAWKIPWMERRGAGYSPWGRMSPPLLSDFTFTLRYISLSSASWESKQAEQQLLLVRTLLFPGGVKHRHSKLLENKARIRL